MRKLFIAALIILASLVIVPVSSAASHHTSVKCAAQPFCADYETGNFSQWWLTQYLGSPIGCGGPCTIDQVGNTSATVITSPTIEGSRAGKFQVFSSGGGTSTVNRAEVLASPTQIQGFEGQQWFYSIWVYFPGPSQTWWSTGGDWNDIFQFFDETNQQAFIYGGVDATSGHPKLYDDGPWGHTILADPLVYDHWYHFVIRVKWSQNSAVGFWKLWLDGTVKQPLTNVRTMGLGPNPSISFSEGFYSDRNTDNTVIQDSFCRANTLSAANAC